MNSNVIQVFEYETLAIGPIFTEAHFKRLAAYGFSTEDEYFKVGHKCIKFLNYVGAIQVGNLTIEILPKTDRDSGDKRKWQRVLIDMLRQTGYFPVEAVSDAHLQVRRTSLLIDLLFASFLHEVERLNHQGLTKKYRSNQSNLSTLKGRLLFREQIKRNLVHKERFFTEHECYDRNNRFNQILLAALEILSSIPVGKNFSTIARSLISGFEDIDPITVSEKTFRHLQYGRNTERYKRAINLARMIILNYSPDIQSGKEDVFAILFDMNILFEKYIYCRLKYSESRYGHLNLRVRGQASEAFWGFKSIRPDIVVSMEIEGAQIDVILDTKWKIPKNGSPLDADLKQMFTYNIHFGADQCYLMYPRTSESENCYKLFKRSRVLPKDYSHGCGMLFLELFDENERLTSRAADQIVDFLIANRCYGIHSTRHIREQSIY